MEGLHGTGTAPSWRSFNEGCTASVPGRLPRAGRDGKACWSATHQPHQDSPAAWQVWDTMASLWARAIERECMDALHLLAEGQGLCRGEACLLQHLC